MDYVNSNKCLSGAKGTILARNACTQPWQSRMDLRITQDFAYGSGKFVVYFDIVNLLNFLDDEKGVIRDYGYRNTSEVFSSNSVDETGSAPVPIINGLNGDDGLRYNYANGKSNWQMNLGFKYKFKL